MVLYLRMLRERVVAKNCCLLVFCLLQVKSFEKLVSNSYLPPGEMWPFCDFQYGFRSSGLIADFLSCIL